MPQYCNCFPKISDYIQRSHDKHLKRHLDDQIAIHAIYGDVHETCYLQEGQSGCLH